VSDAGWCEPDNFKTVEEAPASSEAEAGAASQVGGIQAIFKNQINIYTDFNILSV